MKRPMRVTALLVGCVLVASACEGTAPEAEAEGELVWAVRSVDVEVHRGTVELWEEENPDVPIQMEELPAGADEQRSQIALEMEAESDLFDIVGMDVIWTGEFAENGWVQSLEDIRGEVEGSSLPGALESAEYEGELWAVPYNTGAGFLYYRTDLVDEPPTTWDELMEVGLEIGEEEGIAPFVGQGASYEGMVVNFLEYFWSAGGEVFNEDQSAVLFGEDDAAMQALEFMRTAEENGFYAPGYNTMTEEEARVEFQAGNAVFMRHWPAPFDLMQDEEESDVAGDFDIAPLPTFDGQDTISAVGGYNLAVSAFSDNQELAREFVLFAATNEDVQRNLGENAIAPAWEPVYEDLADDRVFEVLGEVVPHARARPPVPEWGAISDAFQRHVFPAYNGDMELEEAVTGIRGFLEDTIE